MVVTKVEPFQARYMYHRISLEQRLSLVFTTINHYLPKLLPRLDKLVTATLKRMHRIPRRSRRRARRTRSKKPDPEALGSPSQLLKTASSLTSQVS